MSSGGTVSPRVRDTFARHSRRRPGSASGGEEGEINVGLRLGKSSEGSGSNVYVSGRRRTSDGRGSGVWDDDSDFWNGSAREESDEDAWKKKPRLGPELEFDGASS